MNFLLDNLPKINFAEKDTAVIQAEVVARFEKELDRPLYPGDPWRQAINTVVYFMSLLRSNIDFAGKQNLLAFSSKGFIQHLGRLVGVELLEAKAAVTTLRFTITMPMPGNTIIRKGTRVTPGNSLYFSTDAAAEIPAGQLHVDVPATCNQTGDIGNGWAIGQINRLVDTFPFNCSVHNTTVTQGGADEEGIESFRERIRMKPESYSVAGPYGAYEYWAKTASQLIVDVKAETPSPGVVEVVPLLAGGEIPDQSILDKVYATCSPINRRPLTDCVKVRAPTVIKYPIFYRYYIGRRSGHLAAELAQRVKDAEQAFIDWQKSRLGRDITPSTLVEMLKATGIKRVDMDTVLPSFKPLRYYEVAVADMDNVNGVYGGLEDD